MSSERPSPQPASAFARAVRDAREQAGLSPDELARQIRLQPSAYAAIERGEGEVDLELIVSIAGALELSASELIGRSGL
ncbi:MAG TPA: helix-turn-helix transcriptional regulator [Solirubrobacteraceae bacterium]|nr:helix-turn-helix transcriptional regulator [Solirubrobacteraceae bacterium]